MTQKTAGWLIIHTEGKEKKSYPLKEGKNLIGRKTTKNTPDIAITDKYISRHHAAIYIKSNKKYEYEYYIADNAEALGKPSLNGTFINGNDQRIINSMELSDNDTIQVGETKLVLKTSVVAIDVEEAVKLVGKTGYKKTIDIKSKSAVLKRVVRK